jgi:hypothetical protein
MDILLWITVSCIVFFLTTDKILGYFFNLTMDISQCTKFLNYICNASITRARDITTTLFFWRIYTYGSTGQVFGPKLCRRWCAQFQNWGKCIGSSFQVKVKIQERKFYNLLYYYAIATCAQILKCGK